MKCIDCLHYQASQTSEDDDRCLSPKAEYQTGGIRSDVQILHFTCKAMLQGICGDHKLWEARTNAIQA